MHFFEYSPNPFCADLRDAAKDHNAEADRVFAIDWANKEERRATAALTWITKFIGSYKPDCLSAAFNGQFHADFVVDIEDIDEDLPVLSNFDATWLDTYFKRIGFTGARVDGTCPPTVTLSWASNTGQYIK